MEYNSSVGWVYLGWFMLTSVGLMISHQYLKSVEMTVSALVYHFHDETPMTLSELHVYFYLPQIYIRIL